MLDETGRGMISPTDADDTGSSFDETNRLDVEQHQAVLFAPLLLKPLVESVELALLQRPRRPVDDFVRQTVVHLFIDVDCRRVVFDFFHDKPLPANAKALVAFTLKNCHQIHIIAQKE